jgi:hypothetical protein
MKKLSISLIAIVFSLTTAFSQINDMGIIPVGVTLNSILRLNITGGGNLEYNVTTMQQYQTGIPAGAPYYTTFTVASSVEWSLDLYADAAVFTGVTTGATFPVNNLGYTITTTGAGGAANWLLAAGVQGVTLAPFTAINGNGLLSAGGITQNQFQLAWEFGTLGTGMYNQTLLAQNITSDRYVVNVVLELYPD